MVFLLLHDIVACRDQLLGSNRETNNETMSAAKQQILNKQQLNYNRGMAFSTRFMPRAMSQLWDISQRATT
jgi:ferritin-like protein